MAGQLTIDTLKASSGVLATQNGMTGVPKAWVNFGYDGSTTSIRSSFNISSVTRNSTGVYTIAFTTAMPNINYSVTGTASVDVTANYFCNGYVNFQTSSPYYVAPTTSQFVMGYLYASSVSNTKDPIYANIAVFSS